MRIKHIVKKFYSWLLPYHCIFCHHASTLELDLCEHCRKDLPILTHFCRYCARELYKTSSEGVACGECLKNPPPMDASFALFLYEDLVKNLILDLKFKHSLVNARLLGELLAQKIQQDWYNKSPLPDVIIPVPLHAKRIKERGFNQSLEIARPIAKRLQIPIENAACQRVKFILAQATLAAKERQVNIKNAFAVTKNLDSYHVAILDDVMTTGQTIIEMANTLKKAGAKKIDVWCCARTSTLSGPCV